jgi:hypothetical protein
VGAVWAGAVVLPGVATARLPLVLQADSVPGWALASVALIALAATRVGDYRRLSSRS